ncbi:MAG: TetR/AcrR family transcriptional regulator [Methanolobus sp.]
MQCRGYNGFSYKDISQKLGIKNASIHHYYPKKEDLVAALLEERRKNLSLAIAQMVESKSSLVSSFNIILIMHCRSLRKEKCICPPGSVIIDFEELPAKVKKQEILLLMIYAGSSTF